MTSTALIFNPLRYAKKLVEVGFTKEQAEVQAEAQAEAINNIVDEKLATKLEVELIRRDIRELNLKIETIKKDIIIKLTSILGSLLVGGFTIIGVLISHIQR